MTHVEVEVAGTAAPNVGEVLSFLVDSGGIHSVVPAAVLDRLGIEPLDTQEFMLADRRGRSLDARVARCSATVRESAWPT